MLSFTGTKSGMAKVYSYKRCIWADKCPSQKIAQVEALRMYELLDEGDEQAVIEAAEWCAGNRIRAEIGVCLSPYFYLDVESGEVRSLDRKVIWTVGQSV